MTFAALWSYTLVGHYIYAYALPLLTVVTSNHHLVDYMLHAHSPFSTAIWAINAKTNASDFNIVINKSKCWAENVHLNRHTVSMHNGQCWGKASGWRQAMGQRFEATTRIIERIWQVLRREAPPQMSTFIWFIIVNSAFCAIHSRQADIITIKIFTFIKYEKCIVTTEENHYNLFVDKRLRLIAYGNKYIIIVSPPLSRCSTNKIKTGGTSSVPMISALQYFEGQHFIGWHRIYWVMRSYFSNQQIMLAFRMAYSLTWKQRYETFLAQLSSHNVAWLGR